MDKEENKVNNRRKKKRKISTGLRKISQGLIPGLTDAPDENFSSEGIQTCPSNFKILKWIYDGYMMNP